MALPGDHTDHSAHPGATRLTAGVLLLMILSAPSLAAWEGYERLTRESLLARLAEPAPRQSRELKGVNLSDLDLTGIDFHGADLSGARLIGDLHKVDLTDAKLTHVNGAADMKNQSMGLMRTSMVNATARHADLSDSDFSRADLTGADLQGVRGLESATKSGTRGLPPGATISSR